MAAKPRYMSDCEKRLVDLWYKEDKESVEEIARRLHRNTSSIWDLFGQEPGTARAGVGRKASLTEDDKDWLVELTEKNDCNGGGKVHGYTPYDPGEV